MIENNLPAENSAENFSKNSAEIISGEISDEAISDVASSLCANVSFAEAWQASGIALPNRQRAKIEEYARMLWHWNTKLNLTRHTTPEKFIARDVVDALKLANHLRAGEHILDVGTGGGAPGIILAILRRDVRVELCDATGKKANVVGEMLEALKLDVPIWHAKAEKLLEVHRFTTLVIRAVSRLRVLLEMFAPSWQSFDRLLLVKGPKWIDERGESRHFGLLNKLALRRLESYAVAGADGESVILQICRREHLEKLDAQIDDNAREQHVAVAPPQKFSGEKKTSQKKSSKKTTGKKSRVGNLSSKKNSRSSRGKSSGNLKRSK